MKNTSHISFQFKYGTEGTHCIIPTIKTFRNNFAKHASLKFMGDNWFVGIKWFNQVVGLNVKIKRDNQLVK